jgi:hypothetical protein
MSKRPDEASERCGGQRAVDPAVPLGQLGVVVIGAQHHLKRPTAAHQPGEVLPGAAAREKSERWLELAEGHRLTHGEAHVACQHEFAARRAYPAFDLGDADQAARAQMTKYHGDRSLAGQPGGLYPVLRDPGQVDMRDEVVRVAAGEDEHPGPCHRPPRTGSAKQGHEPVPAPADSWVVHRSLRRRIVGVLDVLIRWAAEGARPLAGSATSARRVPTERQCLT